MRLSYLYKFCIAAGLCCMAACSCNQTKKTDDKPRIVRGLYSFGPEIRTFQECGHQIEFWVTDSSAQLELQYSQLNFEKPYIPVYVEVEAVKRPTDKSGLGSEFDSTLVVKRVIKITREIPQETCN